METITKFSTDKEVFANVRVGSVQEYVNVKGVDNFTMLI